MTATTTSIIEFDCFFDIPRQESEIQLLNRKGVVIATKQKPALSPHPPMNGLQAVGLWFVDKE